MVQTDNTSKKVSAVRIEVLPKVCWFTLVLRCVLMQVRAGDTTHAQNSVSFEEVLEQGVRGTSFHSNGLELFIVCCVGCRRDGSRASRAAPRTQPWRPRWRQLPRSRRARGMQLVPRNSLVAFGALTEPMACAGGGVWREGQAVIAGSGFCSAQRRRGCRLC